MRQISLVAAGAMLVLPLQLFAGTIFVSGHDPDYHASIGPNAPGAQDLMRSALDYTRDGSTLPILFLQTSLVNLGLGDHTNSEISLIASGYTAGNAPGNHYILVNSGAFATADLSLFSTIFIPSDHGGTLTGDDLAAVNARSSDIINYLNAGGGVVALAEDGLDIPASSSPPPAEFGFLPFLISSTALGQEESGNLVTPFGQSIGLANSDVNGNFTHNFFSGTGGLNVVDIDSAGHPLSLGFRGTISITGAAPEPGTFVLVGLAAIAWLAWPRRSAASRPEAK